jgi:hypothetical protein
VSDANIGGWSCLSTGWLGFGAKAVWLPAWQESESNPEGFCNRWGASSTLVASHSVSVTVTPALYLISVQLCGWDCRQTTSLLLGRLLPTKGCCIILLVPAVLVSH